MSQPTTAVPPDIIVWLRRIIFWVQPLIVISYLSLALWGTTPARPQGVWLVVLVLPAFLMLPGMWAGGYRAFVWAALADLFYLLVASTDAWTFPPDRPYNLTIVILSIAGFCAAWAQGIIMRRRAKRAVRNTS